MVSNPQNFQVKNNQNQQYFINVGEFQMNLLDLIGQGSFSKVFRGYDPKNKKSKIAVKVIQKQIMTQQLKLFLKSQLNILKKIKHPNIISVYEINQDELNYYIVMQLCNQGNLEKIIDTKGQMKQSQALPFIKGVFQGLLYLSELNIIHRDIKAQNIFLHNNIPKIADFGFAVINNEKKEFQDIQLGSPIYMSPQSMKNRLYGPKTDVWAFGIFVYEILHGKTPYFHCKTEEQLKQCILMQIKDNHIRPDISFPMRQIILKCLQINPSKRVAFQQLAQNYFLKKVQQKIFFTRQSLKLDLTTKNHNKRISTFSDRYFQFNKKADYGKLKHDQTQRKINININHKKNVSFSLKTNQTINPKNEVIDQFFQFKFPKDNFVFYQYLSNFSFIAQIFSQIFIENYFFELKTGLGQFAYKLLDLLLKEGIQMRKKQNRFDKNNNETTLTRLTNNLQKYFQKFKPNEFTTSNLTWKSFQKTTFKFLQRYFKKFISNLQKLQSDKKSMRTLKICNVFMFHFRLISQNLKSEFLKPQFENSLIDLINQIKSDLEFFETQSEQKNNLKTYVKKNYSKHIF